MGFVVVTHDGEDKYCNYPSVHGPFYTEWAAERWVMRNVWRGDRVRLFGSFKEWMEDADRNEGERSGPWPTQYSIVEFQPDNSEAGQIEAVHALNHALRRGASPGRRRRRTRQFIAASAPGAIEVDA